MSAQERLGSVSEGQAGYSIRSGYKQVSIGLIPTDWGCSGFGQLYSEPSRNGIYKTSEFHGRGIRIVNMGEMFGYEFIGPQEMKRVELSRKELSIDCLEKGDLLFGRRSIVPAGAGKCSMVLHLDEPLTFESSIIRVRLNLAESDPRYYYYFFASTYGRSVVETIVSGTNVKGVRGSELRVLPVPQPSVAEQEAIAEALGDADALGESLDQLLAKKRNLKQAALQQLLTGKKRLPGFDVNWKSVRLDSVALFLKGNGLPKSAMSLGGKHKCIHYGELFTRYKETIQVVFGRTDSIADTVLSKKNDVLMPTSDVTPRGLAKASCLMEEDIVIGGDILVIRGDKNAVCGSFLSYTIRYEQRQVLQLVTGSTVYHLYASDMKKFEFKLPEREEQDAIVGFLADMDTEIASIEAKIKKTRQIKAGMLQELITGKTRLV